MCWDDALMTFELLASGVRTGFLWSIYNRGPFYVLFLAHHHALVCSSCPCSSSRRRLPRLLWTVEATLHKNGGHPYQVPGYKLQHVKAYAALSSFPSFRPTHSHTGVHSTETRRVSWSLRRHSRVSVLWHARLGLGHARRTPTLRGLWRIPPGLGWERIRP